MKKGVAKNASRVDVIESDVAEQRALVEELLEKTTDNSEVLQLILEKLEALTEAVDEIKEQIKTPEQMGVYIDPRVFTQQQNANSLTAQSMMAPIWTNTSVSGAAIP